MLGSRKEEFLCYANKKTRRNTENEIAEPVFEEFPYLKQQMQKRNKHRFCILIK